MLVTDVVKLYIFEELYKIYPFMDHSLVMVKGLA